MKHASAVVRNGTTRSRSPSPLLGVLSSTLQYNGPYCMDSKDDRLEIKHGLHRDYIVRLEDHIKTVLYHPKKRSCTVLHSGGIRRYIKDQLDEEFEEDDAICDIEKLLHAPDLGVYIGVCKQRLKLLNRSFQSLCTVECSRGRITAAEFNPWSGEVVTASPGSIMVCVACKVLLGQSSYGAKLISFRHGYFVKEQRF